MEQEATYDDVVNYVSASILSGPEDDIWDNIFDWIQNAVSTIVDAVVRWINNAVSWITTSVRSAIQVIISPISTIVSVISQTVTRISTWVYSVYSMVSSWVSGAYTTIFSAVTSAIGTVRSWILSAESAVRSWVTTSIQSVWEWITASATNLSSTISAWFSEQWSKVSNLVSAWGESISEWFSNLPATIGSFFEDLWLRLEADREWLTSWMIENIVNPIDKWWDQFLAKVFDFGAWVSGLLDAAYNWFTEDVAGFSERGQTIMGKILSWFYWFFTYSKEVSDAPLSEKAYYSLNKLVGWIGDVFNAVFSSVMNAFEGYIKMLGPTNPDIAEDTSRSLSSVGLTALSGLAGMTLASSWMKPLGGAGMGQIAAMIYDMTNYKVITGASITALTVAAIKTPLTYHFNEVFRPNLLEPRDFMQLMSRKAFIYPEALQNPALTESIRILTGGDGEGYEDRWIGYHGYPAVYHGLFKELANTPLRYFPLAGIARTGFYEKVWFTEALHRSGYSRTAIDALMVMYEKMRDEALQGAMSGAAVTRFKEGFTTEQQFEMELQLLGYSPQQSEKYLVAARIDYATDYLRDLLAAYRDAVRKGNISIDEYREILLGLGLVPERVEGYVFRERARIRPKEALTPVGPPAPAFETDAGRLQADTLRRQRRKLLISRDQEISGLLALGMEVDLATAYADNDDARLAEKGGEE